MLFSPLHLISIFILHFICLCFLIILYMKRATVHYIFIIFLYIYTACLNISSLDIFFWSEQLIIFWNYSRGRLEFLVSSRACSVNRTITHFHLLYPIYLVPVFSCFLIMAQGDRARWDKGYLFLFLFFQGNIFRALVIRCQISNTCFPIFNLSSFVIYMSRINAHSLRAFFPSFLGHPI